MVFGFGLVFGFVSGFGCVVVAPALLRGLQRGEGLAVRGLLPDLLDLLDLAPLRGLRVRVRVRVGARVRVSVGARVRVRVSEP